MFAAEYDRVAGKPHDLRVARTKALVGFLTPSVPRIPVRQPLATWYIVPHEGHPIATNLVETTVHLPRYSAVPHVWAVPQTEDVGANDPWAQTSSKYLAGCLLEETRQ